MIGALALAAIPPFSGFYSKDTIIEAVRIINDAGCAVMLIFVYLAGAFITPLYIFRALFLTFHGEERMDEHTRTYYESPWVVLIPLIALAVPSIVAGGMLIGPMLFSESYLLGNSYFCFAGT